MHLQDTIRCLTLAIKSSKVKVIFRWSLKNVSVDEGRPSNLILELASLFVEATGVDSDDIIYNSIEECLKVCLLFDVFFFFLGRIKSYLFCFYVGRGRGWGCICCALQNLGGKNQYYLINYSHPMKFVT